MREQLVNGMSHAEVAAESDVPIDTVHRVAVIAGLGGAEGAYLQQPDIAYKPSEEAQAVLEINGWSIDIQVKDRPQCSLRDAAICESLILEDITLDDAGKRVPFTREAARKTLLKHTGLSPTALSEYKSKLREARRIRHGAKFVLRLATESPTLGVSGLSQAANLSPAEVANVLGSEEVLRRRPRNTWTVGLKDELILDHLRQMSMLPGGNPLTADFYDQSRTEEMIGSVRITQIFKSWSAACDRAGVPFRASRREYNRKWSSEELLEWAQSYIADPETRPSYQGFTDWLKARKDDGAPSSQTVRNYLGTWDTIVELALENDLVAVGDGLTAESFYGVPETRWSDKETDSKVLTRARLEQSYLRDNLLSERTIAACDLCSRMHPKHLLIAAHIVPRRLLNNFQRREFEKIAILACPSCDAYFEWGYLVVGPDGWIERGRAADTQDLDQALDIVTGRRCLRYSAANADSFAEHRSLHAGSVS